MDLIKTSKNDSGEIVVSGRELHEFLEINSNFTTWFERMKNYGFNENIDFITIFTDSKKGIAHTDGRTPQKMAALGYSVDHILTIDTAKEISMIQRNEKGKQARQYFIEVEKEYKKQIQPSNNLELALQAALEHEREIKSIKTDVSYLKDNMRIDSLQQQEIQQTVAKSVVHALGGKDSNAYQAMSKKTFPAFWNEFKNHFKIPRYGDLPKIKFDEAIRFIELWRPSTSLQIKIDRENSQMRFE